MLSKALRVFLLSSLVSSSFAAPIARWKREVPQEHSHEATLRAVREVLNRNNPDGIVDVVFGLLGNAAASQGLGQIADPDCLQSATADQAFSNAKADGDVEGMTQSLIYRTLERNTGRVGLASVLCTSIIPVNPEIAALSQHQDPASDNAAAVNKAITLELAKQINSIGGNPLDAIQSGTFAPGDLTDATARGNTCNDENDAAGCIISQNLLVPDATEEEILAAVAGDSGEAAESSAAEETSTETASDAEETNTATETASDAEETETATATETASDVEETGTATETESAPEATETAGAGNGNGNGGKGRGRGGKGRGRGRKNGGARGNGRNRGNGRGRGGRKGGNGGNGGNDDNEETDTAAPTETAAPSETESVAPTETESVAPTETESASEPAATETPTATESAPEASETAEA